MDMLYLILAILLILIILLLQLRLRIRLRLNEEIKDIFFGLGYTGVVYDFSTKLGAIYFSNRKIKDIVTKPSKKKTKPTSRQKDPKKKKQRWTSERIGQAVKLIPAIMKAAGLFVISLFKKVALEECRGEITAGLPSPDLTGYVNGWYYSLCGAVPGFEKRVSFQPVWTEPCFKSSFQASVGLPLYYILWRSLVLLKDLPLRELIKLSIGRKERSHDG